jgi:hypothetical protein
MAGPALFDSVPSVTLTGQALGSLLGVAFVIQTDCLWIAPCPTCGAVCRVTVTSSSSGLSVDVYYACQRKHAKGG